ncbi:MAG TPA: hypothetical protein VLS46_06935, partial [Gaiellaceae bacterium]|nr:hypothetical protein [Gaiellaceae bacterium]
GDLVVFTPIQLTVVGYDADYDGGVRVGGDTIVVCNLAPLDADPKKGCAGQPGSTSQRLAGPESPLVVYGDTSQDGVWYGGHSYDIKGYEFGPKPFDPFTKIPDDQNEDDEWTFPLGNPFDYAGNDVIDARALFADVACTPASCLLPSVGFTAYGGAGNDIIFGSQAGDHLAGGSGDDEILGQRGVDHIYGDSGFNVNVLDRGLTVATENASPLPSVTLIGFLQNGTTIEPVPSPVADTLDAGRDVIHGEGLGADLGGPQQAYDDVIFGDHGEAIQQVIDPNEPDARLQKIQTTSLASLRRIESRAYQNGDDDAIFGNLGRDVLIGGAGHDMVDGDEADDLIFGDNVIRLLRRIDEATLAVDITSPHFQSLCGTLIYSRSDRPNACGGSVNADNSGELLVNRIPKDYRDPDGAPWWAEYTVDFASLHTFAVERGDHSAGTFGNDYLAGGAQHDLILGQLGDDVIQGDGGIELAFAAVSHAGASRTPEGCLGTVCDVVGDLDVVASFEAVTDGEDYIEGNGGDDVVFGGLGQDDIVGGSSDFFSLTAKDNRPDGEDLLFGGAGTQIDRNNEMLPLGTAAAERHARDADTFVGDNGRIIRIVGLSGADTGYYVTFVYDTYSSALRIVVRGVELLDYSQGGPDFQPTRFGSGPYGCDGLTSTFDIGGADEVHGETGDDTVYTGCGADVVYGDGDDDDVIAGYGHDWVSGGTGQDGVIGDDGRIFTSRNSTVGEPLYGVAGLLATDPDTRYSNGNVLNEFIYTPGEVQTATINLAGALNKAVDITPFNLTPNASGADEPLFVNRYADDIIFGGLNDDFLHGASGDDGISGAEALNGAYGQFWNASGDVAGIVRSDWTRPFNGGDMLNFGEDVPSWKTHNNKGTRQGEFALYDEFDPRRAVLLNDDGSAAKTAAGYQWLLNFDHTDGHVTPSGCVLTAPNGSCLVYATVKTDGADVIFGDLGNDWLVGGTGNDTTWGGWGNDLLNVDDVMTEAGDGTYGDGKPRKIQPSPNDTPDTHPTYQDRAYGGAGLDILMGNTGGDRLIDWVGEFNSYLVPFAPFGIATVSRQVPPWLYEFLYALSRAQGADPTRATDTGNDPLRNGEPDGELGLITQKDHGLWQEQTGGPTDPQPGNVPGGKRDVLRSADFNDGSMSAFATDAGTFTVAGGTLRVTATNQGGDAAAVFYHDEYLPVYYEIVATVAIDKAQAGWEGNAYAIFDYFSPTDFKFVGINQKTNKLEMGQRTASGWNVVAQSPMKVWEERNYTLLIAINGTAVTVVVDNKTAFTHVFAARVIYGEAYGLNKGLVGFGSNNSRGYFDNIAIQILPPKITLDHQESFDDGTADVFAPVDGTWSTSGGAYI